MSDRPTLAAVPDCGHADCIGSAECTNPDPTCRWADGEHGPCGGPFNGVYCWDHKEVGRQW